MAIKSTADLLIEANLVKNATIPGENTALRVGGTMVDMIDSQWVLPPQPIIYTPADVINGLPSVLFMDNGYDFSVGNPELFLFRYKPSRRYKKNAMVTFGKKRPRYYHPCTVDANIKWSGWKFFGGTQTVNGAIPINTRITEWALPSTLKPYEKYELTGFNKYMFWQEKDATLGFAATSWDTNIFAGQNYNLISNINQSNANLRAAIGGFKSTLSKNYRYPKVIKYAFAVGIDNPNATKSNGLCPKIFGPMSEPVYAVLRTNNELSVFLPDFVMLVNEGNNSLSRAVRPAKF